MCIERSQEAGERRPRAAGAHGMRKELAPAVQREGLRRHLSEVVPVRGAVSLCLEAAELLVGLGILMPGCRIGDLQARHGPELGLLVGGGGHPADSLGLAQPGAGLGYPTSRLLRAR